MQQSACARHGLIPLRYGLAQAFLRIGLRIKCSVCQAEMEAAEQGMKSERNRFDSTLDSMPSHIKHSFREQTKVDRQAAKAAAAASPTSAAASAPQGSAAKIKDPSTSSVMSWFGRLRGASESSSATVVSHKDDRSGGQADANAANPIPDKNGPKGAAAAPSAEAKLIDSKSASENVETGDNGAARLASVAGKLFSGWGRRLSSELAYGGAVKPPSSDQGKGVP